MRPVKINPGWWVQFYCVRCEKYISTRSTNQTNPRCFAAKMCSDCQMVSAKLRQAKAHEKLAKAQEKIAELEKEKLDLEKRLRPSP